MGSSSKVGPAAGREGGTLGWEGGRSEHTPYYKCYQHDTASPPGVVPDTGGTLHLRSRGAGLGTDITGHTLRGVMLCEEV